MAVVCAMKLWESMQLSDLRGTRDWKQSVMYSVESKQPEESGANKTLNNQILVTEVCLYGYCLLLDSTQKRGWKQWPELWLLALPLPAALSEEARTCLKHRHHKSVLIGVFSDSFGSISVTVEIGDSGCFS